MTLEPIYQLIKKDLDSVNALISEQLHTDVPFINDLSNHIIQSGGKRLRPMVLILSANACSYQGEKHIPLAVAMEFFHTATLLHDDVVDESELRRGQLTANELFGDKASILVGDFLFTRSFQLITHAEEMSIISLLANTSNRITRGEVLQLLNCKKTDVTETDYFEVIESKTAVLFAAAAEAAGLIAAQPPHVTLALRHYGMAIGNAFQIIDDILDYSATAAQMGKNIGDDLAEGKVTLPIIRALAVGNTAQCQLVSTALQKRDCSQLPAIIQIIEETAALDYCYQTAEKQIDNAISNLQALPPSAYRDALQTIAHFSLERSY